MGDHSVLNSQQGEIQDDDAPALGALNELPGSVKDLGGFYGLGRVDDTVPDAVRLRAGTIYETW
jgi:hypothetical protein